MTNNKELSMILDLERGIGNLHPLLTDYAKMKEDFHKLQEDLRKKELAVNFALGQASQMFGQRLDLRMLLNSYESDLDTVIEDDTVTPVKMDALSDKILSIDALMNETEFNDFNKLLPVLTTFIEKAGFNFTNDTLDEVYNIVLADSEQRKQDDEDYLNACMAEEYEDEDIVVKTRNILCGNDFVSEQVIVGELRDELKEEEEDEELLLEDGDEIDEELLKELTEIGKFNPTYGDEVDQELNGNVNFITI